MPNRIFGEDKYVQVVGELTYRPDLDGLRAVAVSSVIMYHLSHDILPGGYLGVDIFFVLSGFLITSILWRDALQNKFSIVTFYDRRIRRIMPALITVLAFTSVVAAVVLLPADLVGYGKSLLSSLAFVANIYFWRDTDYFAAVAETKPLLHLWSLGVEEQFYILYPWLIALLARFRGNVALACIAILVLVSLLLDVVLRMKGGSAPAFFLLPTRIWELGIGGALAVLTPGAGISRSLARALSCAGAILVCAGISFPALLPPTAPVALPATLGAALIIFSGRGGFIPEINRVLSSRPLVFIGLISYSLYLWHWPVIVLTQYYLVRPYTPLECVVAVLFMSAAAYLSWRYVERPFRGKFIPITRVRIAVVTSAGVLAVFGGLLIWTGGLPSRLSGQAATINAAVGTHYRCDISDMLPFGASRACVLNLPSGNLQDVDTVLLGNSHAQMYAPVIRDILASQRRHGLLVPLNGCLPTVAANIDKDCISAAQQNLSEVGRLDQVRNIVIGLTWWHNRLVLPNGAPVENLDNRVLVEALDDLIRQLQRRGKHVILIGPIAEPGWDVASMYSRDLAFGHSAHPPLYMAASTFQARFGSSIVHFEANNQIGFIRPDTVQCRNARCEFLLDGRSLFSDDSHISQLELQRFRPVFEQILAKPQYR